MRKLLFFFIILFSFTSYAATKTVVANGAQGWGTASNWSPSGVPVNGDEIIIPPAQTISIKGSFYGGTANIIIKVEGTLDFDPSGKLDLGSNSEVQLLSASASITTNGSSSELIIINGVTKYNGNVDGIVFGPAFATSSTGSSPGGFTTGVLPVKLSSFVAKANGKEISLQWVTVDEVNAKEFLVERSFDNTKWKVIKQVQAKGLASDYDYTDKAPLQNNFYRLKMVDYDGKVTFSSIVILRLRSVSKFQIAQNASAGFLEVTVASLVEGKGKIELLNVDGRKINQYFIPQLSSYNGRINTRGLAKGQYFLVLHDEIGFIETKTIIVY